MDIREKYFTFKENFIYEQRQKHNFNFPYLSMYSDEIIYGAIYFTSYTLFLNYEKMAGFQKYLTNDTFIKVFINLSVITEENKESS